MSTQIFLRLLSLFIVIIPMIFTKDNHVLLFTDTLGIIIFIVSFKIFNLSSSKSKISNRPLSNLGSEKYSVFSDIKFKVNDKTIIIDHLIVSVYGIFVIEQKKYKGTISGNDTGPNWTQTKENYRNYFYNPILEVKDKIDKLNGTLIDFSGLEYFPIVCFENDANIDVSSDISVININDLIQEIEKKDKEIISNKVMRDIVAKLIIESDIDGEQKEKVIGLDDKDNSIEQ